MTLFLNPRTLQARMARSGLLAAVFANLFALSACSGGESEPRVAIAQTFTWIRYLPVSKQQLTGIDIYTAELVRAGLHPEGAACALAEYAVSTLQTSPNPPQTQVISFTIPANEMKRASEKGYFPLSDFSVFYDLKKPLPCSAD